jgi:hypothetical protein
MDEKEKLIREINKAGVSPAISFQAAMQILKTHQGAFQVNDAKNYNMQADQGSCKAGLFDGELAVQQKARSELPSSPNYLRQGSRPVQQSKMGCNQNTQKQAQKNNGANALVSTFSQLPNSSTAKVNQLVSIGHGITNTWNSPILTDEPQGNYVVSQSPFQ